jgi:F-type H+-transporting ATPase subunit epsilon
VAHKRFSAEVLTPEGPVFDGEVEMVSTRTAVGSLAVLAGHQPMLTLLVPTELRLYTDETEVERFAQGEGYMQVTGESVLLLVEDAVRPGDLDAADLRDRLSRAERAAERAEAGSEEERQALRNQRRWEAFLHIAQR